MESVSPLVRSVVPVPYPSPPPQSAPRTCPPAHTPIRHIRFQVEHQGRVSLPIECMLTIMTNKPRSHTSHAPQSDSRSMVSLSAMSEAAETAMRGQNVCENVGLSVRPLTFCSRSSAAWSLASASCISRAASSTLTHSRVEMKTFQGLKERHSGALNERTFRHHPFCLSFRGEDEDERTKMRGPR